MTTDNNEYNEQEQPAGEEFTPDFSATDEGLVIPEEKQPVNRSTLVMFAVLVIGAAGLYLMYRRTGPQSASAAEISKETTEAHKTISNFLVGGEASFKSMEARLKNTEKVVQQFLKYPSATQVPLNDLSTNPFRLRDQKPTATNNEGLSEAAEKKRREEERLAIKREAEGLLLQSIMCSETRKACMINSTIYREGQTIDKFTVEKISPSTVLVKNGQYRFELSIQR